MSEIGVNPKAICILGMHRSGTSTVARVINLIGPHIGIKEDLLPPLPYNPGGYWELKDIVRFHDRLLNHFNRSWDTTSPLPDNWQKSEGIYQFKSELIDLINKNFKGHRVWMWKDPRTSLLLPLWEDVLKEIGIELVCVLVIRNPIDVAKSLKKRDGFPHDKSYAIWMNYNITALQACLNIPSVIVNYDKLLNNWELELKNISKSLNISWSEGNLKLKEEISAFLNPDLRHSFSRSEDLGNNYAPLPVIRLYELLEKLLSIFPSVNPVDVSEIDKIAKEFHAYSRLFGYDVIQSWEYNQTLIIKNKQLAEKDKIIETFLKSKSWRLTAPLRWLYNKITTCHYDEKSMNMIKKLYRKVQNMFTPFDKKAGSNDVIWYHDFSRIGLKTPQRQIYKENQICKELLITSYLLMAMEYVRRDFAIKPRVLELFCADGYYANVAATWGAGYTRGVDKISSEIDLAKRITVTLGNDAICKFSVGDVYDEISEDFDIVLCAGGLYHISDPKSLLVHIRRMNPKYLVCQSVVTLAYSEEDYFESPAPGWTWGCRFTAAGMKKMLHESGWEILQFYENELLGNSRKEDRGSAYAFCRPA